MQSSSSYDTPPSPHRCAPGFTLLELIVVIAIVLTLAGIFVVNILPLLAESKGSKAVQDIEAIERQIQIFFAANGHLPNSLDEVMDPVPLDPWGQPYRYARIDGAEDGEPPGQGKGQGKGQGQGQGQGGSGKGKWRKDRFLVPINSDFDLYSMGPDGRSQAPLTAQHSRDDIVRANNGGFIGPAREY